jgi:prophage regulatory protein
MTVKLIDREALPTKGIRWSRQEIDRKVRAGKFPRPVKLGTNTNVWLESEIDEWIAQRISARDGAT